MTPRTPVLVGIGVATQREDDPARALEPLDLMLAAVRNAGADALAARAPLLAGVGRIGVPKGRWRYQNPGGEIARAIGAHRAVSLLASVGVLQQTLIGDACRAIAEGETDTTLVVGGDAGYRTLRSSIKGVRAEERQQDDEPHVSLSSRDELRHPANLVVSPIRSFSDVLSTPQFTQRGFWKRANVGGKDLQGPDLPFKIVEARTPDAEDRADKMLANGGDAATVVDKRVEEGAHLVELEMRIQNQLDDVTADGTSIVELPTRPGA